MYTVITSHLWYGRVCHHLRVGLLKASVCCTCVKNVSVHFHSDVHMYVVFTGSRENSVQPLNDVTSSSVVVSPAKYANAGLSCSVEYVYEMYKLGMHR